MNEPLDIPRIESSTSRTAPVAAVIGVVIRDAHVLLVQRRNPPDAGLWGLPGGKIHYGESIGAAAVREILEETSVTTEALHVFTAIDALDADRSGAWQHHFVLVAVLCRWLDGEPLAADDALEARWYPLDRLDKSELVLSAGVTDVVRQAFDLDR
ncbi:NUDIX hydrolase [Pararobbsia silviterrae]|uniref:NUDIX domain-containing protein n=1 Tax=Pararobbsia silviterrae TaxID=1792498 RepID=A0A494YAN5_9BURK|nr:NUDIX hydrolase [Pararobbsia silviterrae]RKP57705.1 NUDIX domain-containing protein [Pararobbsia silviterrae]